MAWLTAEEFRGLYPKADLTPEQAALCVSSAVRRIAKLIGEAQAEEIESSADNTTDAKVLTVREAQQNLALAKSFDFRLNEMQSERDENGEITNSYRSVKDIMAMEEALERRALDLLEPYVLPSQTDELTIEKATSVSVPVEFVW